MLLHEKFCGHFWQTWCGACMQECSLPVSVATTGWELCSKVCAQSVLVDSLFDAQRASDAHAADKGQRLAPVADRQLHHLQRRRTHCRFPIPDTSGAE